ncbi:MAG: GWxTD domain-containing protein [Candidatus Latescibacterota bacterium]
MILAFRLLRRAALLHLVITCAILLIAAALWLSACGHSTCPYPQKDKALLKLAERDTSSAHRILSTVNWKKCWDPELIILISQMHRSDGTILGRLKAQQLLEHSLAKYSEDCRIQIELGRTYYQQTFYPDAERCFRKALTHDSTLCEAHYLLATNHFRKWKRNQHFMDEIANASGQFADACACDPANLPWAIARAVCAYCRNDLSLADQICRDVISQDSTCAKVFFLRGAIAYRNEQFLQAGKAFAAAIALLSDQERKPYLDIKILLSIDERDEYENASTHEQEKYRRMFWLNLDPDPTIPLNERYLEHISRTFLADLYFSCERPALRGWETERGKALIKFGWPSTLLRTLANMRSENSDGWVEIWTYENQREFVFVDEFLNGVFAVPREIEFSHMAQTLLNSAAESTFGLKSQSIPGQLDAVAFKNGTISSSIFTTARIDADSLVNCLDGERFLSLAVRGVFFNSSWQEEQRFTDTLSGMQLAFSEEAGKRWLYAAKESILPFDRFRLSLTVCDPFNKTRTVFRDVAHASRFLTDSLSVSDILLYRKCESCPEAARIVRGGMSFVSNPGHSYQPGEKLNIYLEIYNLVQYQASYEYDVSYMIFQQPDTTEPGGWLSLSKGLKWFTGIEEQASPFIIQTATRLSFERPAREMMTIEIGALQAGKYLLHVSVFDKYSGDISHVVTTFSKMNTAALAK